MICPKCKFEIDHLNFDVTATCGSQIYASDVKENTPTDYDLSCLTDNVEFDNFSCPECDEVLFLYEDQAKEFLKGGLKE